MVFEKFSIYILGTNEPPEIHGDILFRGKNYKTRKVDGLIVPAIINISALRIGLDMTLVYEDYESLAKSCEEEFHTNGRLPLSEERMFVLERLAREVVNKPGRIRELKELVERPREIGQDQRFPKNIEQTGYRELLLKRIKNKGTYTYGCLSHVYINSGKLNHLESNGTMKGFSERGSGKTRKGACI